MKNLKNHPEIAERLEDFLVSTASPAKLKKILTGLYFEYTRTVIKDSESDGLPTGIHEQLFYLRELIAVFDTENDQ